MRIGALSLASQSQPTISRPEIAQRPVNREKFRATPSRLLTNTIVHGRPMYQTHFIELNCLPRNSPGRPAPSAMLGIAQSENTVVQNQKRIRCSAPNFASGGGMSAFFVNSRDVVQ